MDSKISLEYRGDQYGSRERNSFSISYEELQEILQHQQGLNSSLKIAGERLAADSNANGKDASQAIAAAQTHGTHLDTLVERLWKLVPPLKHTSDRTAAKAQEVFSTPELLEGILSRLTTHDKLRAMQVQRTWRDTMLGSIVLKRELGLLPFEDGKYYSAFSGRFRRKNGYNAFSFPGGRYDDDDPSYFRWDEDSEYSFWTINHFGLQEDPNLLKVCITMRNGVRVGSRIGSMRLCDPPITTIRAFPGCGVKSGCVHKDATWSRHPGYTMNSAGDCFTVGELLDSGDQVIAEHEKCSSHWYSVEFTASIKLNEDDMVMIERRKKEQQANVRRDDRRAERQRKREEREKATQKVNAWRYDSVGHRITEHSEDVHDDSEGRSEEEDEFDDEQSGDEGQDTYATNEQKGFGAEDREGGSSDPVSEAEDYASELGDKNEGTDLEVDKSWVEEEDFGVEEGEGSGGDPGSDAEDHASQLGDKKEGTDLEIDESWVEEEVEEVSWLFETG